MDLARKSLAHIKRDIKKTTTLFNLRASLRSKNLAIKEYNISPNRYIYLLRSNGNKII